MRKRHVRSAVWLCGVTSFAVMCGSAGRLAAAVFPVDLNDFSPSPPSAIVIATDGLSASFTEDALITPVYLENLNFLVSADASLLLFDYALHVSPGNEDYFDFYASDLGAPAFSAGGLEGEYAGSFGFDLVPYRGVSIPLIFDFMAGWDDTGLDSLLRVFNVRVETAPVSVPDGGASLSLLVVGLASLGGLRLVGRRAEL